MGIVYKYSKGIVWHVEEFVNVLQEPSKISCGIRVQNQSIKPMCFEKYSECKIYGHNMECGRLEGITGIDGNYPF